MNDRGNGTTVLSQLAGQAVDVNTILIKYTYNGDGDLSGFVNADDYALIDAGYANQATAKGFRNGDFDYSGSINADDYFLIDMAMSTQAAPLAAVAPAAAEITTPKTRPMHHRRPRPRVQSPLQTVQSAALARFLHR